MKNPRRSLRHSIPSLHGLMLFEASARHLNFSKAADELAITQSAVSHGVKQLEDALGHPLFLRESRALTLTSQGEWLFGSVSRGFLSIAETVEDISATDQKDTVVVSCSTVLAVEWLLPRLPVLRGSQPDLRIELRCLDRDPDLMANGIDVQLRLGDGPWPGLEARAFWPEQIVAVASPDYLRRFGPVALADLPRHRLISYVDPHRFRIGWAEWLRSQGVQWTERLPVVMQVNDSLVSLKAAEAGEGLALGWCPLIDRALIEGRLVQVLPERLLTGRHHHILTVRNNPRRAIRQFCDWLLAQE
jgi:LysR family glycine cleavage system transcriptional activator